ncbi:MAG: ATPase [Prevotella sp.]|nr:ATPase [Prevotella sp.]
MILIADSGGTKTDWTLLFSPYPTRWDVVSTFQTQGINPIHQTPDVIRQILGQEMMQQLSSFSRAAMINAGALELPSLSQVEVFFYGSGCTPVQAPVMKQLLSQFFQAEKISVKSDLMAAARALCQHEPGIACILGTGANSCLYDGNDIVQNTPALGYILGDEGSGAVLGRLFMNAIFKNPAFADVREAYLAETKLTQADIINRVYREPLANRFLASTSLYIYEHLDNPLLRDLVVENFRQFFRVNIVPYQHQDLPVHFVGSMAYQYQELLSLAAGQEGFHIGQVIKSPMEGLIKYHSV